MHFSSRWPCQQNIRLEYNCVRSLTNTMGVARSFYFLILFLYTLGRASSFTITSNALLISHHTSSINPSKTSEGTPVASTGVCDSHTDPTFLCPKCNMSIITTAHLDRWQVSCGQSFADGNYYAVYLYPTIGQCIQACEESRNCWALAVTSNGMCSLVAREGDKGGQPIGHYIEEKGWAVLHRAPSTSELTRMSRTTLSSSKVTPSTQSTALQSSTTRTTASCQASSISCPRCDDTLVKDDVGNTNHVLCGNHLYSEAYSSVDPWLTPEGCMAECDRYTWCGGSTYSQRGNCELARGQDIFPQGRPGYTAFLQINPSYTPPPDHLSAFPTGQPTSARSQVVSSTATPCSIENIRCRQCDGATVVDGFNETYRVQCDFEPICNDITGRIGYTSQNSCMEHCDTDATCLAAIWDNGHCDLCQEVLEGLVMYESSHEYVVFIAEPFLVLAKPTLSSYPPA